MLRLLCIEILLDLGQHLIHKSRQIVQQLSDSHDGPTFWDIPTPNTVALEIAQQLGFVKVRDLTRMFLGELVTPSKIDWQFALADPATG